MTLYAERFTRQQTDLNLTCNFPVMLYSQKTWSLFTRAGHCSGNFWNIPCYVWMTLSLKQTHIQRVLTTWLIHFQSYFKTQNIKTQTMHIRVFTLFETVRLALINNINQFQFLFSFRLSNLTYRWGQVHWQAARLMYLCTWKLIFIINCVLPGD